MKNKLKQFIKNIDTTSLLPMAVFVSIVAFFFWPLKSLSHTAALPCTMLSKSFCMFVLGCYISEIFKSRITEKAVRYIAIVGILFAVHIFIVDGIASLHNPPPVSTLWFPYEYVKLAEVNPFFICLGIIVNHNTRYTADGKKLIGTKERILRNISIALLSFLTFISVMYVINVPGVFADPTSNYAWTIRYVIRMLCFPVWVLLMIKLYRCLTSECALSVRDRYPKVLKFFATFAPIGILFVLFNSLRPFSIWIWFDILYYLLGAYAIIVGFRLAIHLLRALLSKEFGWKEIFLGK